MSGTIVWKQAKWYAGGVFGRVPQLLMSMVVATGCASQVPTEMTTTTSASETGAETEGSSGEEDSELVSLVTPQAWALSEAINPFADERPDEVNCAAGWGEEDGVFEVSTDVCGYGEFVQPSLGSVQPGDVLEFVLVHDPLFADGPATAHVALALGDEIVWSMTRELPFEAEVLRPTWAATQPLAAGEPVYFHVHNHGSNNYRVVGLTRSRP